MRQGGYLTTVRSSGFSRPQPLKSETEIEQGTRAGFECSAAALRAKLEDMFVSHLESALDGTRFEAGRIQSVHQGRPLWVRYDLNLIRKTVQPGDFPARSSSLWRYRELLPLPQMVEPVTLGEGTTPLLPCAKLGSELGLPELHVKDESQLPTGSFKSRGMTVAVSMARHLGIKRLAIPTAGNAGGALAAYAARAGMEAFVFMPEDTPIINQLESHLAGARVFLVNGLITDCGRIVREGAERMGWFDMSTLKEPYRLEGKKTMGLELAEQLGWQLPDVILYPTGGGTGLIGMWKAFQELRELGWLKNERLPRMVACQSDDHGERVARPGCGWRFHDAGCHSGKRRLRRRGQGRLDCGLDAAGCQPGRHRHLSGNRRLFRLLGKAGGGRTNPLARKDCRLQHGSGSEVSRSDPTRFAAD